MITKQENLNYASLCICGVATGLQHEQAIQHATSRLANNISLL
jgi:hypothetical protein